MDARKFFLALAGVLSLQLAVFAKGVAAPPFVNRIVIDGTINPAVAEFVYESIRISGIEGARALVIQLDTPGGLLSSTRVIVKDILGAPLPVIVYVAPSGAGAGSAGMFITISAHVAAMAPATNIGAAHPVGTGGEEVGGVMGEKLENFVASYGEAIARERGRNMEWAVKAVRESVAATEADALELNVIDLVARDLGDLLRQATGREVKVAGEPFTLSLEGAEVRTLEMRLGQKLINYIADPNVAYLLMIIGMLGLYLEFSSPGLIFPGVTGAISLLLALAAFHVLPINYTGAVLIVLGLGLLIAEAFAPSFGILGISGIVSFVLGSLMLFNVAGEWLVVDRRIIFTLATIAGGLMLALGYFLFRSRGGRPATGKEAMVGKSGLVLARVSPVGKVRVQGEIWTAESDETLDAGEEVVVTAIEDLRIRVRRRKHKPAVADSPPYQERRRLAS